MAALDFPSSPTIGQQYAGSNGTTYTWDGKVWAAAGGVATGIAGGDLTGTYPSPTVAAGAVGNLEISDVAWSKITSPPTTFPPTGAAGGDLGGSYPNPTVVKSAGNFTVNGNEAVQGGHYFGAGSYGMLNADSNATQLFYNNWAAPNDLSKNSWLIQMYGNNSFYIYRRPPGSAAGTLTNPFRIEGSDKTYCTLGDGIVTNPMLGGGQVTRDKIATNHSWYALPGAYVPVNFSCSVNTWTRFVTLPASTHRGGLGLFLVSTALVQYGNAQMYISFNNTSGWSLVLRVQTNAVVPFGNFTVPIVYCPNGSTTFYVDVYCTGGSFSTLADSQGYAHVLELC
jgi:hypothetical protein